MATTPMVILSDHYAKFLNVKDETMKNETVKNETKLAADVEIKQPPPPCDPERLVPTSECKIIVATPTALSDIANKPTMINASDTLVELNAKMQVLERQFQTALTALQNQTKPKEEKTKPPKPTLKERMAKLSDRQLLELIFLQLQKTSAPSSRLSPKELTNTLSSTLNNRL